jgi:precorrin-6A/cobalt-precorrin-6A reductase
LLPEGALRVGGFGGEAGLYDYLLRGNFEAVVDATHPFAAKISSHGSAAAARLGISYLRFERKPWAPAPGDRWIEVTTTEEAVAALPKSTRVLLTIGRKEIAPFIARSDLSGILRMIEAPPIAPPPQWKLVLARPPFSSEQETILLTDAKITHLVTKNAGGGQTEAKLAAARNLGIPVVMIGRPQKPPAPTFTAAMELIALIG